MKKLISGISALLTAAMLIAPMSAFADTTVIPDPENMPNPKPGTADTTVEFSVDPAYTVTIPAKVELVNVGALLDATDYMGGASITAENVFLEYDQKIVVNVSSDDGNGFLLANEKKPDYTVPYEVLINSGKGDEIVPQKVEDGGKVAEFSTQKGEQSAPLVFHVDTETEIAYAGKYSDTIVFDIAVEELADNTVDFSEQGYGNSVAVDEYSGTNFKVAFSGGSAAAAYYNTGSAVRVYNNGSFTVTPNDTSKKIKQIKVQYHTENHAANVYADTGSYTLDGTTGTWTGESESVTFTFRSPTGTGHARVQSIEVELK